MEQYTPKNHWLGGYYNQENKKPVYTLETVKSILDTMFEFVEVKDFPFVIREHARKYQWSVAQLSVFRKRNFNNEFV
jgi:hypothetical protein